MRLTIIAILSSCFLNYSFCQEKEVSSERFSWYSGNKSGEYVTLNRDSTAYLHNWGCLKSAFKFGSWSQRSDTITVRTYKYLEADTASYYLNSDTTPVVRVHDGQLVISIMDCSGIAVSNFVIEYYNTNRHSKKLKASAEGEVIIPLTKFSGLFGPYDLRKFLTFGIKDISVFICQEDESSPQRLNPELDFCNFIKTEKGLVEIQSNRLFKKK